MIIVRLMGGLGNQMFQYAAGLRLATARQVELKIDLGWFDNNRDRLYELNRLRVPDALATGHEIRRLCPPRLSLRYFVRLLERVRPYYRQTVVYESRDTGADDFGRVGGAAYLVGYWQSASYFAGVEQKLRELFCLRSEPDSGYRAMAARIAGTSAVSLHIRRGDYVANPATNAVHGVCEPSYYQAACARISEIVKNPQFFVFSDDPDWVQANLHAIAPGAIIVSDARRQSNVQDLWLMTLCRHNIIANSSFSWWGAWLNEHPGKIVIAPAKWFQRPSSPRCDIIPPDWLQL